jgi:diadenosine tetraphosphate (Ap4A) HIT family hydrolase
MRDDACPFCSPENELVARQSQYGLVIIDPFPVSPGHLLVVPRRHVASFYDLDPFEQADLVQLIGIARRLAAADREPDGFNIGLNDGRAAGQTVMHCHWHVIPRYDGDVDDPRGGVRWVVPQRAAYWDRQS